MRSRWLEGMAPIVLSIGDCVRRGRYELVSVFFPKAANFSDGKRWVALVTEEVGPGPLNIVVAELPPELDVLPAVARAGASAGGGQAWSIAQRAGWARARACARAVRRRGPLRAGREPETPVLRVGKNAVFLAGRRWDIKSAPTYASPLPSLEGAELSRIRKNLRGLEKTLASDAPPRSLACVLSSAGSGTASTGFERAVRTRVRRAARRVLGALRVLAAQGEDRFRRPRGATVRAWEELGFNANLLAGCGYGFTPSGDDFLRGVLVALGAWERLGRVRTQEARNLAARIRRVIAAAARKTTPFSRALVELAREARVGPREKDLLRAVTTGEARESRLAARRIMELGATSGADFLVGLARALKTFLAGAK